ncbi:hypothetical protein ABFT80_26830 [Mesorhizobium sp. SB112]|uniref:hypothetical protein n=1 Tax=Mesorhizobium sp. SB112 TaxID=3151853 RepID=UPI003266DE03
MISGTDLGTMLGIFGLSYSSPLFETSYLRVHDQGLFRAHSRRAILGGDDAWYDESVGAWIFDWHGAAKRFLTSYEPEASAEDGNLVKWWIQHGYNGIYTPDLTPYFWQRALHWAKHHDAWKAGIDPTIAERARELLWQVTHERRSEEHLNAIEIVRDHVDEEPTDDAIKSKTRIDFYDDYSDPFLLFTNMRGQFVLMDAVRKHQGDAALMELLNRIPHAWHAEEAGIYADHDFNLLLERARIEDLARDHAWSN